MPAKTDRLSLYQFAERSTKLQMNLKPLKCLKWKEYLRFDIDEE